MLRSMKGLVFLFMIFSTRSVIAIDANDADFDDGDGDVADGSDMAEETADSWDDDDEFDDEFDDEPSAAFVADDDDDEESVPWDNTEDDFKPMEDALPESLRAVIHLASKDIPPGLLEFVQYELRNYPALSARDVGQSPATIRFFTSEELLTIYTLSEALENDAIPEDQLEQVKAYDLPNRDEILKTPVESIDVSALSSDEIRGILADFNVHRVELSEEDEDLVFSDDEELDFGEDGEADTAPRKKRKPVDWRKRRRERLKNQDKNGKETKSKKRNTFEPSLRIAEGLGLGLPLPILFVVCIGGFCVVGYLVYALLQTMKSTKEREEQKRMKSAKRSDKKLKKVRKKRQ